MNRAHRITNIGAGPVSETIQRELGQDIRPSFTRKPSGLWWAELKLPASRFIRTSVCSPGESKEAALKHAISAAKRQRKAEAA